MHEPSKPNLRGTKDKNVQLKLQIVWSLIIYKQGDRVQKDTKKGKKSADRGGKSLIVFVWYSIKYNGKLESNRRNYDAVTSEFLHKTEHLKGK